MFFLELERVSPPSPAVGVIEQGCYWRSGWKTRTWKWGIIWHLLIAYSITSWMRALNSRHRSAVVITFPTFVAFNHLLVGDKWKKQEEGEKWVAWKDRFRKFNLLETSSVCVPETMCRSPGGAAGSCREKKPFHLCNFSLIGMGTWRPGSSDSWPLESTLRAGNAALWLQKMME